SLRLFAVLPRPSSAADAKASTLCSFSLDPRQAEHKTYSIVNVQKYSPFRSMPIIQHGFFVVK
ncbi:MAG: hypothetical protein WBE46_01460, partial [Dehalococcoidia bacterium]